MAIDYQGAYSGPYGNGQYVHPGGSPPPVYDAGPAPRSTPTTPNPYRTELTKVIDALTASPLLPRLCALLAEDLTFRRLASWTTETSELWELLTEGQRLVEWLQSPAARALLASQPEHPPSAAA